MIILLILLQVAADPGTGKIRLNQAVQRNSTAGYIDITDDDGTSIQSFLETVDSSQDLSCKRSY